MTSTLNQPQTRATPQFPPLPSSDPSPSHRRARRSHPFAHFFLALIAATMMLPFLWMLLTSFKPIDESEQFNPLPQHWQPQNYPVVLGTQPDPKTHRILPIDFKRWYFNSVFVASWVTFLQVLTSSMAAYAFSRLRWKGRDTVFKLYLATMMIPGVVVMIPNYALMMKLHLLDSYLGLIVPASFSAFGTFLLRQFMLTIPPSLDESASIDGASKWQIYWDLIMPLARPGLIALAILTFLGTYGSFTWPLVMIKSEHLRTLPIGMLYFDTMYGRQTNLLMAASVMNIVPLVILFVCAQKFLVKGIQLGAVKG
jgi:multiple sugar transport system permease protein